MTQFRHETPGNQRRLAPMVVVAVLAITALGVGIGVAATHHSSARTPTNESSYAYYESMMGRLGTSSMMGGSSSSMMGTAGYQWTMGGASAPGWMHGASLPAFMMGTATDPGEVMGRLFADAPGARVTTAEADRLGNTTPHGATVNAPAKRITFSGSTADLVALASPSGGPGGTFRIAGLVNPTIVVKAGTRVSIEVVNSDPAMAHGLVITKTGAASSWMPMMTSSPAFSGAALWFLGDPTSAGMHDATINFTADSAGAYQYLCAVPGHAQKGMFGTFVVTG